MAVPTSITDCNATAANNSPAGSDSIGTSLDDYLRAHAAIIRQAYDALVAVDATLLPKAGGSVTGTITTTHQIKGITPVSNQDLTRKDYVDDVAKGPAFIAIRDAGAVFAANVSTTITGLTEVFDTASVFNHVNGSFTPNIAGYYQVNANATLQNAVANIGLYANIIKNGVDVEASGGAVSNTATYGIANVAGLVYMNGTTDYLNLSVTFTASSGTGTVGAIKFSASLARAA